MCDPFTMAAVALTTTAANIYAGNKAASAASRTIDSQLAQSEAEIAKAEVSEVNDRLRLQRKEQARIKVAAGEAGLQFGGSIEALLKDSLMQTQLSQERTRMNAQSQRESVRAEANAMYSRNPKTNALGAGLQLAASGLDGWSRGRSMRIEREATERRAGRAAADG
ncbi:hypothetical protein ACIQTU_00560 [Brevundimonas sp. NPDC090276]|uniref:virion core protein, T7 gp14 family n=1 Tax=Brevundimonas sp. NPDC090276 TaxID=3363956 RepID=UPI00383B37BE